MAARKSKSAKARTTPKKKTAKGSKSAARSKAPARPKKASANPKSDTKKPSRKKRRSSAPELAEVVIKKPTQPSPRQSNSLNSLLSRLRTELGPNQQPAWLVDAAAGSLIPINEAGATLFDINNDDLAAVTLDQSMPALSTLRKLTGKRADSKNKRRTLEDLLFWTPTGAHLHTCQITAHTLKGRIFFLVQSQDKTSRTATSDNNDVVQTVQPQQAAPSAPRDDAAILREIARRIRAGTNSQPPIDDVPGELPDPKHTHTQPKGLDGEKAAMRNSSLSDSKQDPHQRAKLAHELRTPISAIIAASEIIKDERLGSLDNFHYRDYARDIHQSARHALELIEQGLQAISDKAPGLKPSQTDRADFNHLVRSAIATVKHLAHQKNVSVAFVPGERDACLQMDPTAINQIVLNLLTNAVKFTESGGSVTAQVFSSIGEDIRVEVRDTGCGMSKAEITQHLDARSERAPQARAGGGFGIGLALSRRLAESNGASLEIESVPGRGTKARLAFPLRLLVAA